MTGLETNSPEAMERSRAGSVCTPGVSEGRCPKKYVSKKSKDHISLQRVWRRPPGDCVHLRPLHSSHSIRWPRPPGLQPRRGGHRPLL